LTSMRGSTIIRRVRTFDKDQTEAAMKILRICCGVAVLFTTLAFAHLLHHHVLQASSGDFRNPVFVLGFAAAVAAGILSLTGGCILLKPNR
jgi:hypothetical protein